MDFSEVRMGFWSGRTVAVTGGAGSFGKAFVKRILQENVKAVRVISRDEYKHVVMAATIQDPRVKYLIGDVRDRERLMLAFDGVDTVIHAAALKRVEKGEEDPLEFVRTNVGGAEAVIHAARERHVERVVFLSSDKACQPVTTYGQTKALAERLFVAANVYTPGGTRFSATRYGNVTGSRGSLVPLLMEQRKTGTVTITDGRMTRFAMLMSEAVGLVMYAAENMAGGEIYVPKIPSARVADIIAAVAPESHVQSIGIRGAEKLHEALISSDEARNCKDVGPCYVIGGVGIRDEPYTSETNPNFLKGEALAAHCEEAMRQVA